MEHNFRKLSLQIIARQRATIGLTGQQRTTNKNGIQHGFGVMVG
jgi:hypothetical protein